jgi:hypothetical protein
MGKVVYPPGIGGDASPDATHVPGGTQLLPYPLPYHSFSRDHSLFPPKNPLRFFCYVPMFPPPATPHAHPPACSRLPSRRRPRSYRRRYPWFLLFRAALQRLGGAAMRMAPVRSSSTRRRMAHGALPEASTTVQVPPASWPNSARTPATVADG